MSKKIRKNSKKKESILLVLYNNVLLRTKVDNYLDQKVPYKEVITMCRGYGVDISAPTLSRYAQIRKSCIASGEDLGEALNQSQRAAIRRVKSKEVKVNEDAVQEKRKQDNVSFTEKDNQAIEDTPISGEVSPYISDLQVLNAMISRGYKSLLELNTPVNNKDMISAIIAKAKLTNNANRGLSIEGLQELRIYLNTKIQAITNTVMTYVPEEKQEEALNAMAETEQKVMKDMNTTAQGQALIKYMKESGEEL